MPSTIKPKTGSTTPAVSTLSQNEIAVDTTNKRIFIGAADGSGVLIGSAPGGSNTQIQFNDGGVLAGDSGLTFDKTTNTLTVDSVVINGSIAFTLEGATANDYETQLYVVDPTQDRTIIFPDANGTVALVTGSDTQVIFSDGGTAFAGDAGLTYNKTTDSLTVAGDIAVNGGDITSTATTFNLLNSTVTTLNLGGSSTNTTLGATSGTCNIRNSTLNLGNTECYVTTNSGTTNNLNFNPYGKLVIAPQRSGVTLGSFPSLSVENTDGASGVVEISGGDLYLGRKTADDFIFTSAQIIFEGNLVNTSQTTLTVTNPTADRTITLPDLTGTVALVSGSDTQVMFNDGGSAIGGDSGLTYNKTTDTLTVSGPVVSSGGYRITSSAINAQTDNYTLTGSDNGKIITVNAASVKSITVPTGLDVGFNCTIMRIGSGRVTFSASGTTINSVDGLVEIASQHGAASLLCYSSNTFNLSGNLG